MGYSFRQVIDGDLEIIEDVHNKDRADFGLILDYIASH